jgi:hypothetical protein
VLEPAPANGVLVQAQLLVLHPLLTGRQWPIRTQSPRHALAVLVAAAEVTEKPTSAGKAVTIDWERFDAGGSAASVIV